MSRRIVVVGSSNTDMIVKTEHLPKPGETVIGGKYSTAAGGKGANQAVAAARIGGDVSLVARVGDDLLGEQAVRGYSENHIDVTHVTKDADEPTGVALILVDRHGENSIAVASGANSQLRPEHIEAARETISNAQVLLLQLEIPLDTVRAAVEIASDVGATVILNPAPAQPLDDDLLRKVDILTPNAGEAELLTGLAVRDVAGAQRAAASLIERGVGAVVVTLGDRGAFLSDQETNQHVAGFFVDAIDTTAAGDAFNGALAVALAEGGDLPETVRFANSAGALAVTKLGAQPSAPQRSEIENLLRQ